ncbi:hypothetical protein ACXR2T_10005 [Leucobacter sp. HY1910]
MSNMKRQAAGAKQAGVSVGGQFAASHKTEASGAGLSGSAPSPEDLYALNDELTAGLAEHGWVADTEEDYDRLDDFTHAVAGAPSYERSSLMQSFLNQSDPTYPGELSVDARRPISERSFVSPGHTGEAYRARPPAAVRHPDFTAAALEDMFDGSIARDGDWLTFERGYPYKLARVLVSDDGDALSYEEKFQGKWVPQPHELEKLQDRLRHERLAAAGIELGREVEYVSASGATSITGGRRTDDTPRGKELAKLIRADVKRATAYGALPEDMKVSVRTDSGGFTPAFHVTATMPAGRHRIQRTEGMTDEQWHIELERTRGTTAEGKSVQNALSTIGEQWRSDEIDSMRGYRDSAYYCFVDVSEERPG